MIENACPRCGLSGGAFVSHVCKPPEEEQLPLLVEPAPEPAPVGQHAAAALAQTIVGFAAPGRYESGKKVPAKVQARAEEVARAAVRMVREAIDAG